QDNKLGESVAHLKFSPDGTKLAVATVDGQILIFDVSPGNYKQLKQLEGPNSEIQFIEWDKRSMGLFAGDSDSLGWVFSVSSGRSKTFSGSGDVSCGCFSSNGINILMGFLDSNVIMWSISTGEQISAHNAKYKDLRESSGSGVTSITTSYLHPDVGVYGNEKGDVVLFRESNGELLHLFNSVHKEAVEKVAFCSLEMLLDEEDDKIKGNQQVDKEIDKTQATNIKQKLENRQQQAQQLYQSLPHYVASASLDGNAVILDLKTNTQRGQALIHEAGITCMQFFFWRLNSKQTLIPDSNTIIQSTLSGGSTLTNKDAPILPILVTGCTDGSVHIWNASSAERIRMINAH
ncbi:MAG: hypothetical protein EZS28_046270, partial [Streblomastix strix]